MPAALLLPAAIVVSFAAAAVTADACLGEFSACPTGECVLSPSFCGRCKTSGEYLCSDGQTCVSSADAVKLCPISSPLYNWTLPTADRVWGTIAMLTLEEKAALVVMRSQVRCARPTVADRKTPSRYLPIVTPVVCLQQGVLRLGIPVYNFWTEAQHGVGVNTDVPASSFPNTNTLASAWSSAAFTRAASMAALEARGRHAAAVHAGSRFASQESLSLFAPEMNVVRAPLWGRAQESCGGEDPLLNARHSAAFVVGLQEGSDPAHLLTAATCKDFPVYVRAREMDEMARLHCLSLSALLSIPQDLETTRFLIDANLSAKDVAETYLPPFIGCAAAAGAAAVMSTYYAIKLTPSQTSVRGYSVYSTYA